MTSDDQQDGRIEAAVEAVARQAPPADHLARVLALSGPSASAAAAPVRRGRLLLRPRWVLPVAATVLLAASAWQGARVTSLDWPSAEPSGARSQDPWGAGPGVERPVLPPEMYWAMDPFAEFATLRPFSRRRLHTAAVRSGPPPSILAAVPAPSEGTVPRRPDDEQAPLGPPTDSPAITLATIMPAPVIVSPLPAPPAITLTDIAMAPITLAPIDIQTFPEEENP